ncbi:MAG: Trp biosynthesis-associated membrane protein [Microbacteriaceae bacterium]
MTPTAPPARGGRRLRSGLVVAGLAAAGLAFLAWTQSWIVVDVTGTGTGEVSADGASAAPAVTALALAQLALCGALAIAGRAVRRLLALVQLLLGAGIAAQAATAIARPLDAAASAIAEATGVRGGAVPHGEITLTAWPGLALAAGVALVALGVAVLVTAGRWPGPARRYQQAAPVADAGETGATGEYGEYGDVASWDALSRGEDPTVRDTDPAGPGQSGPGQSGSGQSGSGQPGGQPGHPEPSR